MSAELQTVFDVCLERLLRGEATLDACVRDHPDHQPELRHLLVVALDLRRDTPRPMSDDAMARGLALLDERLIELSSRSEAPVIGVSAWERLTGAFPRFMPVRVAGFASAIIVALVAYTSVTFAAANSGPDSALYGYRLSLEEFRIAFAPGEDQARLHLDNAEQRLREIETTVEIGDSDAVRRAIDAYESSIRKGVDALGSATVIVVPARRERTVAVVETFRERLRGHRDRFDELSAAAGPGSVEPIARAKSSAEAGLADVQSGPILALAPTPPPADPAPATPAPIAVATEAPTVVEAAEPEPTGDAATVDAGAEVTVIGILQTVGPGAVLVSGISFDLVDPEAQVEAPEVGTWVEAIGRIADAGGLTLQTLSSVPAPAPPLADEPVAEEPTPAPTESAETTPTPTEAVAEEPTPAPTESAETTPTPTETAAEEPTPAPTESAETTPTPTEAAAEEPTPTPTESAETTPTPTEAVAEEPTPTPTESAETTPTPTEAVAEEPTPAPTETPEAAPTPTEAVAEEPTPAPTETPEAAPTPTEAVAEAPAPASLPTLRGLLESVAADRVVVGSIVFTPSIDPPLELPADLAPGDLVLVSFEVATDDQGATILVARSLERVITAAALAPSELVVIEGLIESLDEFAVVVNGQRVAFRSTDPPTAFDGAITVGSRVVIEALRTDGTLIAERIAVVTEAAEALPLETPPVG